MAAAGPLGPHVQVDPTSGRTHLCTGPLHYAADIAPAEEFFARKVRQLAEDAGLFHPRVQSVVLLSDGGEWIENRWASLGFPDRVTVFDILDVRHFDEHVWTAARACWGEHQTSAHRFAAALKPLSPKDHPHTGRLCIPHAVCRITIPPAVRHRRDWHHI